MFSNYWLQKSTSTIRDNAYDSVEKYETELEKLCLESHNGSVTYSIRIKTEDLTNDYEYKYLGSLKIKKNNFKVIQQKYCQVSIKIHKERQFL